MKTYFKNAGDYEIATFLVLFVYFIPLIFFQSARFLIHDNLDGLVPLYRFMGNPDVFFADSHQMVSGLMGELPRSVLPSQFSFFRLLFVWFETQTAYSLHYVFQHLMAFIGLRLLLRDDIARNQPAVYNLVALAFSMLPFWPGGELTVAGLPILLWSLIRIWREEAKIIHWILVGLFPFFSVLPFGNMFSFPLLFVTYLTGVFLLKSWRFSFKGLLPFVLLGLFTLISEFEMFRLLFTGFQSNRLEDPGNNIMLNLKGIIGVSVLAFLFGHYHFHSLHLLIALLGLILILLAALRKDGVFLKRSLMVLTTIACLYFLTIYLNNVKLLEGFNFSVRFWVVFPLIWYVYFAWMLVKINRKAIILALSTLQILWVMFLPYPKDYYGSAYAENVFYYSAVKHSDDEHASLSSYYAISEFDSLKTVYPEVLASNVMCLGFAPAIARYNGFKTYDAYLNLYPLEKWRQIKQINIREFEKAGIQYYSNNRAYLFASETKDENGFLNPEWDVEMLHKIKVKYILSVKPVKGQFTELGRTTHFIIYKIN